jgi:CTP synthase
MFEHEGLAELVLRKLRLDNGAPNMEEWVNLVRRVKQPAHQVTIGVVGKYTGNGDAYISIAEALKHGGIAADACVNIDWIESDSLEEEGLDMAERLSHMDGLIVAPGFGSRGVEGKIQAIKHARETGLPFFGICYGLQMAVIEFARHACGLTGANTEEVNPDSPYPVVHILPEQKHVTDKGASMRLGTYTCRLTQKSKAADLYDADVIEERHRHRYEVNNEYREQMAKAGMVFSGVSPDYRLVEIIELPSETHPYFIATQFHPEFKSRPNRAHPLFAGLVNAALERQKQRGGSDQPQGKCSDAAAKPHGAWTAPEESEEE